MDRKTLEKKRLLKRVHEAQAVIRRHAKSTTGSVSDELIRERRTEAKRER